MKQAYCSIFCILYQNDGYLLQICTYNAARAYEKTTIRYLFKMQCSAVPNSIFHSNSMDKQSSSEMKLSAMQHCELLL